MVSLPVRYLDDNKRTSFRFGEIGQRLRAETLAFARSLVELELEESLDVDTAFFRFFGIVSFIVENRLVALRHRQSLYPKK